MKLKEPDFAQGLLAGAEFGREVYVREERLRIRKAQATWIRELRLKFFPGDPLLKWAEGVADQLDAATKARR